MNNKLVIIQIAIKEDPTNFLASSLMISVDRNRYTVYKKYRYVENNKAICYFESPLLILDLDNIQIKLVSILEGYELRLWYVEKEIKRIRVFGNEIGQRTNIKMNEILTKNYKDSCIEKLLIDSIPWIAITPTGKSADWFEQLFSKVYRDNHARSLSRNLVSCNFKLEDKYVSIVYLPKDSAPTNKDLIDLIKLDSSLKCKKILEELQKQYSINDRVKFKCADAKQVIVQ